MAPAAPRTTAKATPLPKLALSSIFLCNITANFQMVRAAQSDRPLPPLSVLPWLTLAQGILYPFIPFMVADLRGTVDDLGLYLSGQF